MPYLPEHHNGFWKVLKRLMPRSPVWQAATALAVIVLVGVIIWTNVTPPTTPSTPSRGTPVAPTQVAPIMPLRVTAETDQESYLPGEEITIELSFTNTSSEATTISPILPEMEIISSARQEVVRSFAQSDGQEKLDAGGTLTKTLVWNQKDNAGEQVPPGHYQLHIGEIHIEGAEPRATGTSPGSILEIVIRSPQGAALERTVEVNETVSANGVKITLMRVETSAAGTRVYALASLDEGSSQLPALPTNPMLVAQAFAQYSVDSGDVKEAVGTGEDPVEGGVELFWGNLDPIPSDGRLLTFTIISLDEQQGPWEFEILLQ